MFLIEGHLAPLGSAKWGAEASTFEAMKLVVISICKDEEETIGAVLDGIPDNIPGISEIQKIVVSDGSTDNTVALARAHGALVIDGQTQRRLAARFQQAANLALELGADIAVNIDGDLQFDPADIPDLVEPILAGRAEFVAADRFTDPDTGEKRKPENMPTGKYWGNRLGARVVGALSGQDFDDVTCGFRAYTRDALLSLNLNSKYTYTQESFQVLAESGTIIETLPTKVTYYPGRRSRVVTNIWSFVATSGLNILRSFRDFAPLKFFLAIAFVPTMFGFVSAGFVGIHWLSTGRTSPYTALGIVGVYLFSMGFLVLISGLLADMQVRSTRNQEKILRMLKEQRYGLKDSVLTDKSESGVGD